MPYMPPYAPHILEPGRERGRQIGWAQGLVHLLEQRFGRVPFQIAVRVSRATPEQMEVWLYALLDAPTLDSVFEP